MILCVCSTSNEENENTKTLELRTENSIQKIVLYSSSLYYIGFGGVGEGESTGKRRTDLNEHRMQTIIAHSVYPRRRYSAENSFL